MENNQDKMNIEEKRAALKSMRKNLEEHFVELGQLLEEIKCQKLHSFFGYETFREFVEDEFNLSGTLANKLVSNYRFFVKKLSIDDHTLMEIGIDKLSQLRPILNNLNQLEQEEWLKKATQQKTSELKEDIIDYKEQMKDKTKDMKEVFTEQFLEKMVTYFNCNKKELMFKFALFFQDTDLEVIEKSIKAKQQSGELTV